jgi:hypothetical protein
MTTKAAEDFDFIAKRLKEIQEEKERARQQQEPEKAAEDDEFYGLLGYAG